MKYAWAVVEGVATICIAFYVFSKVSARFEVIVVALLLMTYVNVRGALGELSKRLGQALIGLSASQNQILKRLGDQEAGQVEGKFAELLQNMRGFSPLDIMLIALGVVDLLCLYHLLTA